MVFSTLTRYERNAAIRGRSASRTHITAQTAYPSAARANVRNCAKHDDRGDLRLMDPERGDASVLGSVLVEVGVGHRSLPRPTSGGSVGEPVESPRQRDMTTESHSKRSVDGWLRAIDLALACPALLLLGPLMIVRAAIACLESAPVVQSIARVGRGRLVFSELRFGGSAPGAGLARLLNVIRGELSFTGPDALSPSDCAGIDIEGAVRFEVRPGIVSAHGLRKRLGIAFEPEPVTARRSVEQRSVRRTLGLLARAVIVSLLTSKKACRSPSRFEVMDVPIVNTDMDEAIHWMTARAASGIPTLAAFVNSDCLNISSRNRQYRSVLRAADRVFADGIGVRIAARLRGISVLDNVNGTDLVARLCVDAANRNLSIFFLGARPGVAAKAASAMRNRVRGLRMAGAHHGYFSPDEEESVIERINASDADILVVALGAPHQELWLARNAARLQPTLRLGVGGCFDFYSGRIPRAPMWMREAGVEWVWRLVQEPRRMWRRYLVGNLLFLQRAWLDARARIAMEARLTRPLVARRRLAMRLLWKRIVWLGAVRGTLVLKRIVDTAGSATLLLLLSPLLALIALAIRLDSPGAALYSQVRVGRHGRLFTIWKFRSMYVDAEERRRALEAHNEMHGGVLFKMRKDPRVTRVGRILRKTSIDELPQLWNVLCGDMSLVGPRPPLPSEVDAYSVRDRRRLEAKPGITCLWQISGRSNIPFPEQVTLDVEYIESMTLLRDLWILLKTVPAVIRGRGAY